MTAEEARGPSDDPTPPLHRHAALRPLSREHMGGLIEARNLRRVADLSLAERRGAIDGFVRAWRAEIREHFDDEERLLLPLTRSPDLRRRLVAEHETLRRLAAQCEANPGAAAAEAGLVRRLGVLLHDHIRWEEREFFEAVQRDYPEALENLATEARLIEERRPGSRARTKLEAETRLTGTKDDTP